MELAVEREGGTLVVNAPVRIDGDNAGDFHEALSRAAEDTDADLVLDLTEAVYIGSAGFSAVLKVGRTLHDCGRAMALSYPSKLIWEVLHINGLARLFDVRNAPDEPVDERRHRARRFAKQRSIVFEDTPARIAELLEMEAKEAEEGRKRRLIEAARAIESRVPELKGHFDGSVAAADELLRHGDRSTEEVAETLRRLRLIGPNGVRAVRVVRDSTERCATVFSAATFCSGAWLTWEVLVGTVAPDAIPALLWTFLGAAAWWNRGRPRRATVRLAQRAARAGGSEAKRVEGGL